MNHLPSDMIAIGEKVFRARFANNCGGLAPSWDVCAEAARAIYIAMDGVKAVRTKHESRPRERNKKVKTKVKTAPFPLL